MRQLRSCFWIIMLTLTLLAALAGRAVGQVCNLKITTDAAPDYTDLPSLVHSATDRWTTPAEKCWAMFYWNHLARRQTAPMHLHGLDLTDPIRQFNDYGYTMCSTISGINQSIWEQMGLKHRYWDISNHTVSEVFYGGGWHMYDNSLSAIYTKCDGTTLASVEEIGKSGACARSGGKVEPGHIAKYHCLTATSPNGFLTGADTIRSLDEEYRCFNPNGLKLRTYFYDWDAGHRYILNLRPGERYTRFFQSLGGGPAFYVPNHGKDPEAPNPRYRLRGNGRWEFTPSLAPGEFEKAAHHAVGVTPDAAGLRATRAGEAGEVIYKIESANVATSLDVELDYRLAPRRGAAGGGAIDVGVSVDNGLSWRGVWSASPSDAGHDAIHLVDEVNGAYEILVRITLAAPRDPAEAQVTRVALFTTTQLNAKTQPHLNAGRNTVHVGAGEQLESVVLWPALEGGKYKQTIVEERNIHCAPSHPGFQPVIHPARANEEAFLIYRLDAPRDIVRATVGGRFYNRAPKSRITLHYSLDGKQWKELWTLWKSDEPWDVIHYETVDLPAGQRSVWVKYQMNSPDAGGSGCGLYAVRMEANYPPADAEFHPIQVTFRWGEWQPNGSVIEKSDIRRIERLPMRYTIDVEGEDHPVMISVAAAIASPGAPPDAPTPVKPDLKPPGPAPGRWVGRWMTLGKNLAVGKPYTVSHPSGDDWGAGDPRGVKLTDGIVGPTYAGGTSYQFGLIWNANVNPTITLDLGQPTRCASFGVNFHGYPFADALAGEVTDQVEVYTSLDGRRYTRCGRVQTNLRRKDLPINFMLPDDEQLRGDTFRLIPSEPVEARCIRFQVTSQRMFCATELEVLDAITFRPFDPRIALPEEK